MYLYWKTEKLKLENELFGKWHDNHSDGLGISLERGRKQEQKEKKLAYIILENIVIEQDGSTLVTLANNFHINGTLKKREPGKYYLKVNQVLQFEVEDNQLVLVQDQFVPRIALSKKSKEQKIEFYEETIESVMNYYSVGFESWFCWTGDCSLSRNESLFFAFVISQVFFHYFSMIEIFIFIHISQTLLYIQDQ